MDQVSVAGVTISLLYNRAHRFRAHTLQPGSLVPMGHPARNHLRQCGIISLEETWAGRLVRQEYRVTVKIRIKAGRYRYRLSQFRVYPRVTDPGRALRDLYPCDQLTYSYTAAQAQPLRAWHRGVQAYIARLHRRMAGLEPGLTPFDWHLDDDLM